MSKSIAHAGTKINQGSVQVADIAEELCFVEFTDFRYGITPSGNVSLSFGHPIGFGLKKHQRLAMELTLQEARGIAASLLTTVALVQGSPIQH